MELGGPLENPQQLMERMKSAVMDDKVATLTLPYSTQRRVILEVLPPTTHRPIPPEDSSRATANENAPKVTSAPSGEEANEVASKQAGPMLVSAAGTPTAPAYRRAFK
eukprot:4137485-Pyramimonas_sp.AAC.4